MRLNILHTNDFHSKLTDAGASRLREAVSALREKGSPFLLLDAGDAVRAGNLEVSPLGEPVLRTMSELGYAAMTLGNREFHVLRPALCAKIRDAKFPVLCANIRNKDANDTTELPVGSHVALTVGDGVRVVVFGLTVPMVTVRMAARHLSSFLCDDPIVVASSLVAELRPQCDLLVALTHIGLKEDERLAQSVEGIDVIIGGHSHVILEEPRIVNGTPIVQAGSFARFYGHLQLSHGAGEARWDIRGELLPLQKEKTQ